jgi:hypothetical protein
MHNHHPDGSGQVGKQLYNEEPGDDQTMRALLLMLDFQMTDFFTCGKEIKRQQGNQAQNGRQSMQSEFAMQFELSLGQCPHVKVKQWADEKQQWQLGFGEMGNTQEVSRMSKRMSGHSAGEA